MGQDLSKPGELNIPQHFTVKEMIEYINSIDLSYPIWYPDKAFLKEHYEIIQPYRTIINFYKGTGYRAVNNYYKTGQPSNVPYSVQDNIQKLFGLSTPPSGKQFWEYFTKAINDLYTKVKPLDRDIIVFRGIDKGTVGQNFFNGDCIKSVHYPKSQTHRYCKNDELVDFKYFSEYKKGDDVREYVYETLGLVSTGTNFRTVLQFGCKGDFKACDTIFAMRLPAGTKFIMPLTKNSMAGGKEVYTDYEYEFILFPLHSTFIVDQKGIVKYKHYGNTVLNIPILVQYGTFCNDLNEYRPSNMPKLRPMLKKKSAPLPALNKFQAPNGKCYVYKILNCGSINKICNPATGNCVLPTAANMIKAGLAPAPAPSPAPKASTDIDIGKCSAVKRAACKSTDRVCNPKTGQCLKNTAANKSKAAEAAKEFGIKTVTDFTKYFL